MVETVLTLLAKVKNNNTEHKRATRNGDVKNHIAEHHLQTEHQIDWDSATCITYSTDYYQRLALESWFTNLEQTPVNPSQRLIDEIKQNELRENDGPDKLQFDCLTVTIDGSNAPITLRVFKAETSRLN